MGTSSLRSNPPRPPSFLRPLNDRRSMRMMVVLAQESANRFRYSFRRLKKIGFVGSSSSAATSGGTVGVGCWAHAAVVSTQRHSTAKSCLKLVKPTISSAVIDDDSPVDAEYSLSVFTAVPAPIAYCIFYQWHPPARQRKVFGRRN